MPQTILQILLIPTELFILVALCCDCIVSCIECYPWASHLHSRNRTWQLVCNEQSSVWVNYEGTLRALRGLNCIVIFRTGKTARPLSEPHSIGRRSRCSVIENSFLRILGNDWERSVGLLASSSRAMASFAENALEVSCILSGREILSMILLPWPTHLFSSTT